VVIVVLALVGMLVVTRRSRGKEPEPIEEEEVSEEDKKKAFLSDMAGIAGEAADTIERDINDEDS